MSVKPAVCTILNGAGIRSLFGTRGGAQPGRSCWGQRLFSRLEIGQDVQEILQGIVLAKAILATRQQAHTGREQSCQDLARRALSLPDTRHIRLSVDPRSGRRKIRFAVPRMWD